MKRNKMRYCKHIIYRNLTTAATVAAAMAACTDDLLISDDNPANNPDAICFTAVTGSAAPEPDTRSSEKEKQLFDPLEVLSPDGDKLYLHTYESEKVGFTPGEEEVTASGTRGAQVSDVESLIKYNKDFYVHAAYKDDMEEYIEWTGTSPVSDNSDIWRTAETRYWPSHQQELSFHAVSPSSEFRQLRSPGMGVDSFSFSYSAKKGATDKDAEAQPDLLVAASSCNKDNSLQGKAPLRFDHALSAVKFAVRDVLGGEIINIKIANVLSSGDCLYTAPEDGGAGSFAWSNQSQPQTFSQNFNYKVNDRGVIDTSDESKDIVLNNTMPEKTFMMIPQQIPDDAEIVVTLRQDNVSGKNVTKTLRGRIKANNVNEWKAGHEYIYTISTSADNWVYVFTATGNHNSRTGDHNVDGDQIYVYSPSRDEHDKYKDDAYFKVRSFRYRANQQTIIENLPWTATHGPGVQYRTKSGIDTEVTEIPHLSPEEWIPARDALKGSGSSSLVGERKDITMAAHHNRTDWPGDWWLQEQNHYDGNSKDNPWDLSTCGGRISRNTANTYVVDREGWYCFPLVYGNAIKNGATNASAYTYNGSTSFPKHSGNITGPDITGGNKAEMLWSDVYNAVSDVELLADKKMIRFKVNKFNLQQGNIVIGLFSGNTILWSWQIWVTEHWLNPDNGLPHAFDKSAATFVDDTPTKSGRRWRGDVKIDNSHVSGAYGYYFAAYNVGWCDPKNVDYLKRKNTMNFVQTHNGKPTGKTAELPIIQDGDHIDYKVGNNTYYQWGRKDPFIGFHNHDNTKKKDFGNYRCKKEANQYSLGNGIQHPNIFYYEADNWHTGDNLAYLWNSYKTDKYQTKVRKTVYDPCPPGYVTPPAYLFRFVGMCDDFRYLKNGQWIHQTPGYEYDGSLNPRLDNFNGEYDINNDAFTFKACGANKANKTFLNTIWLTSTGNRWYTDKRTLTVGDREVKFSGADNFNPSVVYLWSCIPVSDNSPNAFGLALGYDKNYDPLFKDDKGNPVINTNDPGYVIDSYFMGRKTMARPVRGIREELPGM